MRDEVTSLYALCHPAPYDICFYYKKRNMYRKLWWHEQTQNCIEIDMCSPAVASLRRESETE